MQVKLSDASGTLVANVNIPPFQGSNPAILLWGDRVFSFHAMLAPTAAAPASLEYREANAFTVPIPMSERATSPAFHRPATAPVPAEAHAPAPAPAAAPAPAGAHAPAPAPAAAKTTTRPGAPPAPKK